MTNSPGSSRGKPGFPYETFVEAAVKSWLLDQGFEITRNGYIDIFAIKGEDGARQIWHIECKGLTSQTTVDFCTGVGQLLKRISDPKVRYAIALPDLPAFRKQVGQFAPWVLSALHLHWIWVDEDGGVSVDCPATASCLGSV